MSLTRMDASGKGGGVGEGTDSAGTESAATESRSSGTASDSESAMLPSSALEPLEGKRAWLCVLAGFLVNFIVLGNLYSFGLFVKPLQAEFGQSRASISLIFQLQAGLLFAGGIVVGPISDRTGSRPVMTAGLVCYVVGYVTASFAEDWWVLVVFQGGLVGVANSCVYWPSLSTLPQWFGPRRGLALGLASLGSGAGGVVLAIGVEQMLEEGRSFALRIMAVYSASLLLVAIVILHRRLPTVQSNGTRCCGDPILTERNFVFFLLSSMLFQAPFQVPYAILPSFVEDLGYSSEFAGIAIAMVGLGSAVGRVALGWGADKIGRLQAFKGALVVNAAAMVLFVFISGKVAIVVFALLVGFSAGGYIALIPAVLADFYGPARLGGILGYVSLILVPGSFLGPYYSGKLYDNNGEYDAALILSACLATGSAGLCLFIRNPTQEAQAHGGPHAAQGAADEEEAQETAQAAQVEGQESQDDLITSNKASVAVV